MRKRPFLILLCSCLFLYFPLEFLWRVTSLGVRLEIVDILLSVVFPLMLLVGLIRVSKFGWYTLVALIALWGVRDLHEYYVVHTSSLRGLIVHLSIYALSLLYFINPRVRVLYFDPKLRWWRTKPRYETHLPFMLKSKGNWHYPILRNISEGGCFVETPHLAPVNDSVEITIPLPVPLSVSVIRTLGEVRWVSTNPLRQGMGIQFHGAAPTHDRAIKDYVKKRL